MQQQFDEGVDSWKSVMFLYNSALKEVSTKLEILNDEFQYVHQYNPIEYIKSRIKSPESIVKKLKKNGYESSIQNMVNYVNDIAGIRIVCSFTSDIYRMAEMIGKQNDLTVVSIKDYIKKEATSCSESLPIHPQIFRLTICSRSRSPSSPTPSRAARESSPAWIWQPLTQKIFTHKCAAA